MGRLIGAATVDYSIPAGNEVVAFSAYLAENVHSEWAIQDADGTVLQTNEDNLRSRLAEYAAANHLTARQATDIREWISATYKKHPSPMIFIT